MITSVKGTILRPYGDEIKIEIYLGDLVKYINAPKKSAPEMHFYGMPVLISVYEGNIVITKRAPDPLTKEEQEFLDSLTFGV